MTEELIRELNELKEKTICSSNYKCILNITQLPCEAKCSAQSDLMECLEDMPDCELYKVFGYTHICTCPLRKHIALHFEKI